MFSCEDCKKDFNTKWQLQRHLNKKVSCTSLSSKTKTNSNQCFKCKFCLKTFTRKFNLEQHYKSCKEKDDIIRGLEIMLNIEYTQCEPNICRFCNNSYPQKLKRHQNTCKVKEEYREHLETRVKTLNTTSNVYNINNNTINVLNVSSDTLKKFGDETTEHITNEFLRKVMARLEVPLPRVVSTVAKKIYCSKANPENHTLQITNLRSQWAKISNGNSFDLVSLKDSANDVRNKVTDLYIERQTDEPEYFDDVSERIEKLDEINNQNYIPQTLEEREEQKEVLKLKTDIEKEVKSCLYNTQKSGTFLTL